MAPQDDVYKCIRASRPPASPRQMGIQKYPQKSLSPVIYGRPAPVERKKILMSGHNVLGHPPPKQASIATF